MTYADLLEVDKGARAGHLEQRIASAEDKVATARELTAFLRGLTDLRRPRENTNTDTELLYFVDAEGMRHPLYDLADSEALDDALDVRAALLAYASMSALVTMDLGDLPLDYAKRAVLADATCEVAWQAFEDASYNDPQAVIDLLESWGRSSSAEAKAALPRARDVVRGVAERAWSPADRAKLG